MVLPRIVLSLSLFLPLAGCDAEDDPAPDVEEPARGGAGKADATGSCKAPSGDRCGDYSASGSCWCDSYCVLDGSCCGDVQTACPDVVAGPEVLIEGLDRPESAVFDPVSGTIFVTNLAHNILETDPLNPPEGRVGFVSRHYLEGDLHTERFAESFVSPKGIAIAKGVLYVADPKEVVAIDIESASRVASYTIEDVGLFNDVAPGPDGKIYATDTANPGLYDIDPYAPAVEAVSVIVRDERFEFPNGVTVVGQTAYVATTGLLPSEAGPGTPGRLFAVRLDTAEVREVEGVSGKWDGVVVLPDGTLVVNDFMDGTVHSVDATTGEKTKLLDSPIAFQMPPAGIADMNVNGSTLLLPSMFTNELWIYAAPVGTGEDGY